MARFTTGYERDGVSCKIVFKCNYVNIQHHSGSPANFSLLEVGDTIIFNITK